MADHRIARNETNTGRFTLAAGVESIVFFEDDAATIFVTNTDGTAPIWFTTDKGTATVDGTRCEFLPAAVARALDEPPTSGPTEVHLISTGTPVVVVGRG